MKGPTLFTILMLIGFALMVLGVTYMPVGHEPIKFAWHYVVAIIGLLIEVFAFIYLNWLRKLPG